MCVHKTFMSRYGKIFFMKKVLSFFLIFSGLSETALYNAGDYYHCEHNFGGGISGIFGINQRNGTISNPYIYDPKKPSREYIYFLYSSYPYPSLYVPIIEQTDEEIFLQGSHNSLNSQSKKEEPFFVTINKNKLSMTISWMNYQGKSYSTSTQCCESFKEGQVLDDGTFQPRKCK